MASYSRLVGLVTTALSLGSEILPRRGKFLASRTFWPLLLATLTDGFDFQHGVSYQCSAVTKTLKRTVLGYGHGTKRQTDRRTKSSFA